MRTSIPSLTTRALKTWCGTDRISALSKLLDERAPASTTPAASVLALFVAGQTLPSDRLRALDLDELIANELIERTGDLVRARVAILPIGSALLVCDRLDAPDEREVVCWPDDSSLHLAGAIPAGRRARWLDIGCGSAFAQLARPELATELVGIDINPRALRYAALGASLSGLGRMSVAAAADGRFDLVTCNAPLPGASELAVWRHADAGFFAWLWPAIADRLAPGGLAVVHAARRAIPDDLAGERTIVAYADEAVLWWRPDRDAGDAGVVEVRRALTVEQPHIEARDLDDARAQDR